MKQYTFQVQLLSDVVITKNSATEGSNRSLDYIPGNKFLGFAAGRLYKELNVQDAFCAFHSGNVRFGHALPLFDGRTSFPIPLSIHRDKLVQEDLYNFSHPEVSPPGQAKQIRQGYLNAGEQVQILSPITKNVAPKMSSARRHFSRRPVTEGAEKNQLFAYESISEGTEFRFTLSIDDSVSIDLVEKIKHCLTQEPIKVGRSRRAEYGQANVTFVGEQGSFHEPSTQSFRGSEVTLYLASDLAFRDPKTGQPSLQPSASLFGLPETAELDWDRSFLQTRRYSPFNRKHMRHGLERQLLSQGSVLVFQNCSGVDKAKLQRGLSRGVGEYVEQGLGVVFVDPRFLAEARPTWQTSQQKREDDKGNPADPLTLYLSRRLDEKKQEAEAFRQSREWVKELAPYARKPKGPGRAQWGMLRQIAAQCSNGSELYHNLFHNPERGNGDGREAGLLRRGVRAYAWNEQLGGRSAVDVFQELADQLFANNNEQLLSALVQQTAARILHTIKQNRE